MPLELWEMLVHRFDDYFKAYINSYFSFPFPHEGIVLQIHVLMVFVMCWIFSSPNMLLF